MITEMVDIRTPDGICDCFVATPHGRGIYPSVIIYMDAFGPRAYLYEMAKKIAHHGFLVLLPNLFYRMRRAPVVNAKFPISEADMPTVRPQLMSYFEKFKPEQTMEDTSVFLDFLAKQKHALPGKIGITGYCLGGGLAIRAAAQFNEHIACAASFHAGRLATDTPDSPHHLLDKIKAELYIAHADNDSSMPPEQIELLHKALEQTRLQTGLQYEAETYTGATHGFTMADLPAYEQKALERHWEKLFGLLERTLKTGPSR